ncbi:(2,3-dihydroxybenzoyl)adenylate synthase [Kibdelosporangium aridum]|uniref:(2,3-dihydroxybenzoyl)adenylate synthase n=1 Tax=Kibdelosporangium aridum TaxID=2030 RepID=UPI001C8C5254|nr:AMP-binding protein [Kibdelosporangium aridum]
MIDGAVGWPAEFAAAYQEAGYWRNETLGELLREWAQRYGETTALVSGVDQIGYRELDERANAVAAGLLDRGITQGDRVVVQLPNTATFVVLLFALARIGAVPVLALPAHRRTEIAHLAGLAEAVGYIVADTDRGFDYRDLADEVTALVPSVRHVLVDGELGRFGGQPGWASLADVAGDPTAVTEPVDPAAVAVLLVSGGTTGKPKLISRTHNDYAYNARASAELCGVTAQDRYLVCLPVAHNFPLACPGLLGTLGVGGTVVLCPAPSADVAFDLIERERVTVTALVPPLARLWVEAASWAPADLSSLRLLQVGGAKLDANLAGRIPETLGCHVQQVFGMAEGLLNFTRLDDPAEVVQTTQGRPLSPADEIRVVDRQGHEVEAGAVGELLTRGPYTPRGYYRAAEYNATAFTEDGFFRTGDLVRRLASGNLVVEGRVKDVINRGGENVPALELEEHLLTCPGVAQVAVVGLPDPMLGEAVCAAVVATADGRPTLSSVRTHLAERGLAQFKHPDRLIVLDELPLTAVGKINKQQLVVRLRTERKRAATQPVDPLAERRTSHS